MARPRRAAAPSVSKNVPETPAAASFAGSPAPSSTVGHADEPTAAVRASRRLSRPRSATSRYDSSITPAVSAGFEPHAITSPPGAAMGMGRSSTACTALNITVVAPMARASVVTVAVA